MRSEKEKMLGGELYNPLDSELTAERERCRELCRKLNQTAPAGQSVRNEIFSALFGAATNVWIEAPFYCDYGYNIRLGEKVFFNFNCVVLDVMSVTIGDHVLFGPAVQIYTALHPIDPLQRRNGLEYAKPVTIGSDVWVGGGAIICPGVRIGDRAVIGAGSVVTRDIPPDTVAVGNPARAIRRVDS